MAAAAMATRNQIADVMRSVTSRIHQETAYDVQRHEGQPSDPEHPIGHSLWIKKLPEDEHRCGEVRQVKELFPKSIPKPLRFHSSSLAQMRCTFNLSKTISPRGVLPCRGGPIPFLDLSPLCRRRRHGAGEACPLPVSGRGRGLGPICLLLKNYI